MSDMALQPPGQIPAPGREQPGPTSHSSTHSKGHFVPIIRVPRKKQLRCNDAPDLAKTVLKSKAESSARGTRQRCAAPGPEGNKPYRVERGSQDTGDINGDLAAQRGQKDEEHQRHCPEAQDEGRSREIRSLEEPPRGNDAQHRTCSRRDVQELIPRQTGKPKIGSDGGELPGETVTCKVGHELRHHESVRAWILEARNDLALAERGIRSPRRVFCQAELEILLLARCEPLTRPWGFGIVWEDEEDDDAPKDRHQAFENVDPMRNQLLVLKQKLFAVEHILKWLTISKRSSPQRHSYN